MPHARFRCVLVLVAVRFRALGERVHIGAGVLLPADNGANLWNLYPLLRGP